MSRRDDLDPKTRAVSDTLDEWLFRHHGRQTSWANPEDFIEWLGENGYEVRPKRRDSPPASCCFYVGTDQCPHNQ